VIIPVSRVMSRADACEMVGRKWLNVMPCRGEKGTILRKNLVPDIKYTAMFFFSYYHFKLKKIVKFKI
jgi:hypothetical protein